VVGSKGTLFSFMLAEYIVNFAIGMAVEKAFDSIFEGLTYSLDIWDRYNQDLKIRIAAENLGLGGRGPDAQVSRPMNPSHPRAAGADMRPVSKLTRTAAGRLGKRLSLSLTLQAVLIPILAFIPIFGAILVTFELAWTFAVIIILPVIMAEFIPPDGICPVGYNYNAEENVREQCGQMCWEIITQIPIIGDLLAALGPFLCHNSYGEAKPKIYYEGPLYYNDSSLSIFAMSDKPLIPPNDPAYYDKRQYYQLVGYDFESIHKITSMNRFLNMLQTAANLNKHKKAAPPIWVDFSNQTMLNKMAEYYYKMARRLPYTNEDGSISFEYISKIYGVAASTKYTCDIQCEITIDTLHPQTGKLKSRIIAPTDNMGNTYHDRRFYFFVDTNDELYGEIIHGKKVSYIFKSPTSHNFNLNLEVRGANFYQGIGKWDQLMEDNMARYHITGSTCINYTAPQASDSTTSGYAGDMLVSVADPGTYYFNPTLSVEYNDLDAIPDNKCGVSTTGNMTTRGATRPMSFKQAVIPAKKGTLPTNLSFTSTMYDGTEIGKNITNGENLKLTLALTSDNKLTFKEISNNRLTISSTKSKSYSSKYSGDIDYNDIQNGWHVRIRARKQVGTMFEQFSFDATIQNFTMSTNTIDYVLQDIRNIRGNFNTDGRPTILESGIILFPIKWPVNSTKIWDNIKISSKSIKQMTGSIIQGIFTGIIAQAPGLGLVGQFAGGLLVTALQAGGVLDMIACTYQDTLKAQGTYIVNGNVLTSQINNNQDSYIIVRGPTIDYSPGYTPIYNKCSNISIVQNDCINRYNIRLAVKTYQTYYKDKLVKRIFKIRTIPEKNMCVYDIEHSGFDSLNSKYYDIPNKFISFGIQYTINTDTCAYFPEKNIILNPPTIREMTYVASLPDPTKTGYQGDKSNIYIHQSGCPAQTCGTYKIRKELYSQLSNQYQGNPEINPDTIYKEKIAMMTLSTKPSENITITPIDYNNDIKFSNANVGEVLRFEQMDDGPYIFEGILNENNKIINIDILYPYIESVQVSNQASNLNMKEIQINNSTWLKTGYYVNVTSNNDINFDAIVDSYVNNIATLTPCIKPGPTTLGSSIVIRFNYKSLIIYPYTYTYTFPTQEYFSGGSYTFKIEPRIEWLQANMNINMRFDNGYIHAKVVSYNLETGDIVTTTTDGGSYYTQNIIVTGRDINQLILEMPNIIPLRSQDQVIITYISNNTSSIITTTTILSIVKDIKTNTTRIIFQIADSNMNNSGLCFIRLIEDWTNKTYNIHKIEAYGTSSIFQNNPDNRICTYKTEMTLTNYDEYTGELTKSLSPIDKSLPISMVIKPSHTDKCVYDLLYDNIPTKYFYPFVPGFRKYIEFPMPLPQYGLLAKIANCEDTDTSYRDCSGIDIVKRLVDKYNSSHENEKILKVLRAYTIDGSTKCEYQVEMSRQIPGSRDRMIKKENIQFNMVPEECRYTYNDEPNFGYILTANQPDPYSSVLDMYAMNPIYIWPTSLMDRYRILINQAISIYQSMTPTWSSILTDVSQTAENRMKGIFNEIYSNRNLGNCKELTCRDNNTLMQIVKQYNYDNYPNYKLQDQYGYIQRSIIQVRRGGLGGTLTQCHIELIEKHDFYEDYTLSPIQTDNPTMARFNTKYFLRQYQFDIQINNCNVSGIIPLTKDQINNNFMDISSNPFGLLSDVSIVQYTPPSDMELFNLGEFYSIPFLNRIARIYNNRVINKNTPEKKNTITIFKNAFIISPTICEYEIVINRNIYSDEYGLWVPTDGIQSYIWVQTDSYSPRVVTETNISEICVMDVNFKQEGNTYVPRDAKGNILKLPYMFYTDLTNTTSRVIGLSVNGTPGNPNTSSNGYIPSP
jgi:hypothetical protein